MVTGFSAVVFAILPALALASGGGLDVNAFDFDGYDPILNIADMSDDKFVQMVICAGPLFVLGVLALIFVCVLQKKLKAKDTGVSINNPRVDYLAKKIKSGSIAFLKEEYKYLVAYVGIWTIILAILFSVMNLPGGDSSDGVRSAACFIVGAFLSGFSGFVGMSVATDGNIRTAVACFKGTLNDGLGVAFTAGAAMGFGVVGLASMGLSLMMILMVPDREHVTAVQYLHGFGFGASSIALFARVAGGIYTKAADVGADLVGKVEAGIDEDDPHNPAVIADNVGDNVGDVAGMGADLFESYVGSILATATLGAGVSPQMLALPMWLASAGLIGSFIGFFFVSTDQKGEGWNSNLGALMWALEKGTYVANGVFLVLGAVIFVLLMGPSCTLGWKMYGCVLIGMATGMIIGKGTEYFTSFDYGPTKSIKDRARTGPATVIIQGMGVGMISTCLPTLVLATAIVACAVLAKEYGVALAAVGMLSTLAISLSTDAYGPVADNAGGLAEMGHFGPEVRAKTDSLDALGNTTAAIGKGFAVGSAVLTALSLLAAFKAEVMREKAMTFEVSDPVVLAGMLVGTMMPYLFGALTMISVGKAAAEMIEEVRRQFREVTNKKGKTLMEAIRQATAGIQLSEEDDVDPDSDQCILISTKSSVKEMIAPGVYSVLTPLIVGLLIGARALMGLLAGCIGSAAMLAVMMGNAGGAWDNSKKLCEKLGIKKTDQGKACVVGDTVGDPFKDTSGPSLDILLKLMSMIALLIAPVIAGKEDWELWHVGLVPLAVTIACTFGLIHVGILTWKDPLAEMVEAESKVVKVEPSSAPAASDTGSWKEPEPPRNAWGA
eukprot:gnl/TRDRNA2_/TRDRNA2_177492_c0_seq2.p1 gnl/TRDRNA2_/TRDRNA2_177492_c0~~gnl/TRDRNA2_/TRDRNA2_177492_c0_seq2.p1  ORF type:complete len:835 (+),score=185.14 gnl/TRDRNA2_/TRDRNA2_177492_c0_seq2:60-2564(+)